MAELTPLMKQYRGVKDRFPDAILLFRMGDFYELFYEDALRAAPLMEVQLTTRDKNASEPVPMCGVPHHSVQNYLQKLLAAGCKVAVCEQLEDPATTKGIVKRDVVRVLTPALIGDPELVGEEKQNTLAVIQPLEGDRYDVALLELLSGKIRQGELRGATTLLDRLLAQPPQEILIPLSTAPEAHWVKTLRRLFPKLAVTERELIRGALAGARQYIQETQRVAPDLLFLPPEPIEQAHQLTVDATSLRALEILEGQFADPTAPCLLKTLNFTVTAMGRRMLRDWLRSPLSDKTAIDDRLAAVDGLLASPTMAAEVSASLSQMRDLERLATKTALGLSSPKDLANIRVILRSLPSLKSLLSSLPSGGALKRIATNLDPLPDLSQTLDSALEEDPPGSHREGGIFRPTFQKEIAELRALATDAKQTIAQMEIDERAKTGISTLKIKYSRVFGYTIEVTKSHVSKVPASYIRKQTIANGERYVTPELKQFEEKAISASFRLNQLEETLFLELRQKVATASLTLMRNARLLAELDVLGSFAVAARKNNYNRPTLHTGFELEITDGRHPVVEQQLEPGAFIPNSLTMNEVSCRSMLLTGPNMAGKSTVMRQMALILLMAHVGCFVPARRAHIPLTDAIFTRVGASDDLAHGRSTFMVEMSEVARIIRQATVRSFLLIDEIGRGTSTYDGLSLAWSLLEHLHQNVGAKTVFATHFHELTALEKKLPGLHNATVLVKHGVDGVVFLHRLVSGVCDRSYGIEVARLAGLPDSVLQRAALVLNQLEASAGKITKMRELDGLQNLAQLPLFEPHTRPEKGSHIDS